MDAKLRAIVSKAAGTYFIVTDKSQVENIEADAKLRLFFINSEKGQINVLFKFAKGDISGFQAIFGKPNRLKEKKGNFSITTCMDALTSGPIAVINLRKFDNTDKADVAGMSMNTTTSQKLNVPYSGIFDTNSFWVPKTANVLEQLTGDNLVNFANIGINDKAIFVVKANSVVAITAEGDKTLAATALEIDEYPALNTETLVKDTFVDVYVFDATFDATASTNRYYGHLFDGTGKMDLSRMDELIAIKEAGFAKKFTGSLIPGLKSETDGDISIDTVINATYQEFGIFAAINDELFEGTYDATNYILDVFGFSFFQTDGITKDVGTPINTLSYAVPATLTSVTTKYPPMLPAENVIPAAANNLNYEVDAVDFGQNWFIGSFEQGLRIGDRIKGIEAPVFVTGIEIIDAAANINTGPETYTKVKYTCSGAIDYHSVTTHKYAVKLNLFIESALVVPTNLISYKPREAQFTNGSAARQSEILDMMLSPGIVKGVKSTPGIRYVVDCYKSFVESGYKSQYGQLMVALDDANRFVRAIINEPFMEDLTKSSDPLFKQAPGQSVDLSYLATGGNPAYSTRLLSKFSIGESMCFFFGPGNVNGSITFPIAGKISNKFYLKGLAFDVLANESGYVDGITALEYPFDDDERAFLEGFRYNPVIFLNGGNTIYGNLTGQLAKSAQQQIHNSELLAYIKENLYNLSKSEAFKKGNYDDYLRTETQTTSFMNGLVLGGAIQANPVVICNASNNTLEIAKQKIKLVHIEYTAINSLEKVVFDLQIN